MGSDQNRPAVLRVAGVCNTTRATRNKIDDVAQQSTATTTQPQSLKALAQAVIARNKLRNNRATTSTTDATPPLKTRNNQPELVGESVARSWRTNSSAEILKAQGWHVYECTCGRHWARKPIASCPECTHPTITTTKENQ